ncbi:MAG: hypothetical protein JSW27_22010 [Phycisphaerales bacterium]|nr:MAG: hypothetical protein JSW27_22010 [Phycisphaerales bacterium]
MRDELDWLRIVLGNMDGKLPDYLSPGSPGGDDEAPTGADRLHRETDWNIGYEERILLPALLESAVKVHANHPLTAADRTLELKSLEVP